MKRGNRNIGEGKSSRVFNFERLFDASKSELYSSPPYKNDDFACFARWTL